MHLNPQPCEREHIHQAVNRKQIDASPHQITENSLSAYSESPRKTNFLRTGIPQLSYANICIPQSVRISGIKFRTLAGGLL